jgi:hypothetical protein
MTILLHDVPRCVSLLLSLPYIPHHASVSVPFYQRGRLSGRIGFTVALLPRKTFMLCFRCLYAEYNIAQEEGVACRFNKIVCPLIEYVATRSNFEIRYLDPIAQELQDRVC